MTGLLGSLGSLSASANFSATLQPQVDALGSVSVAVDALSQGPQALLDLEVAIDGLPVPPALDGLGQLAPALATAVADLPGDVNGQLDGLLSPLDGLVQSIAVSPAGQIMCVFEVLREVLKLVTGQSFGGALGMPDGDALNFQDLVDLSEVEDALTEVNAALDAFGPNLDAARVLQSLQDVAPQFDELMVRFPPIPVVQDMAEALATIARWQSMTGAELTAELSTSIRNAAKVIDFPHDRVLRDAVAAAETVANGPATLAEINADLATLFADLGGAVRAGSARPSRAQLARIETALDRAGTLARAMDPDISPLGAGDRLVCDLVEARLASLRVLQPQCPSLGLNVQIQAWLDALPPPEPAMFAEIVQKIDDFDLSALTDPLETIRQVAQDTVDAFNDARDAVRDQIAALLVPVADALDTAIGAAQLADIQAALDDLPGDIQQFVDDEIVANLDSIRTGISDLITQISDLADGFDPDTLVAPIADAINEVGNAVNNPDVQAAFADVEAALTAAIDAIADFDLAPATDESITLIADIDAELAKIDPDDIPDAAKPLIEQGVAIVANINFSAEVSAPLEAEIQKAVEAGPNVVLAEIEAAMDEARLAIEGFRPSAIIADTLDAPFTEAISVMSQASPDALFERIEVALAGVQAKVQVLDVGAVVDPLEQVHGELAAAVAQIQPSQLLKPVDDAIAAAIEKIYEVSGLDAAFDGINDVLGEINRYVGLVASIRDLLARIAGMLSAPGSVTTEIDAAIAAAVDSLDAADLTALDEAFAAASAAVQRTERDAVAGAVARSYRAAGTVGPGIGASAEVVRLNALVGAFPLDAARGLQPGTPRARLIAGVEGLAAAGAELAASTDNWRTLGPQLVAKAGSIQVDLLDYYLAGRVEDVSVLASFATPPANHDALKAEVRAALNDGVAPILTVALNGFAALAPHAQVVVQGLSDTLDAVHSQIDAITGAGGLSGTVGDVEAVANLLRTIDLSPVTDPLDAIHARLDAAVGAISPAALRPPLEAARDAIAGLVDLSLLIDPADRVALDAAFALALDKLSTLSPSEAIGAPLDIEYEEILATVLPILDLPARLRAALLDAGLTLGVKITAELARLEAAFDEMLRAIPIRTGVSVSASASVSVSV